MKSRIKWGKRGGLYMVLLGFGVIFLIAVGSNSSEGNKKEQKDQAVEDFYNRGRSSFLRQYPEGRRVREKKEEYCKSKSKEDSRESHRERNQERAYYRKSKNGSHREVGVERGEEGVRLSAIRSGTSIGAKGKQQEEEVNKQASYSWSQEKYQLKSGTVINGVLITGINSDLPGVIKGMVVEDVYDSVTGKVIVIPKGSQTIGRYESKVVKGQRRVLVVWDKIHFPNGVTLNLEEYPGVDTEGYSGFSDKVDRKALPFFRNSFLVSLLGGAMNLMTREERDSEWEQLFKSQVGFRMTQASYDYVKETHSFRPTLKIRRGYKFSIVVLETLDIKSYEQTFKFYKPKD